MNELLEHCPLCTSGQFTFKIRPKDHTLSGEDFSIQSCTNCGLAFTNPRPSLEQIGSYYESPEYISHTNKTRSLFELAYKLVRRYTLRQKEALVRKWTHTPQRLLDVGCGTGHFLHQCQQKGWIVDGIEVNAGAREQAETLLQKTVYSSLEQVPGQEPYHCITLWHVLEHVHDLRGTLRELKSRLAEKGSLVLALPNPDSFDALYYKEFWAAYDVPRHLYHFNQKSIQYLAKEFKFRLTAVLPMKFDAYYVSLLSEKYAHGKMRWLPALKTGWQANRWAKANQENFSSLIYILENESERI